MPTGAELVKQGFQSSQGISHLEQWQRAKNASLARQYGYVDENGNPPQWLIDGQFTWRGSRGDDRYNTDAKGNYRTNPSGVYAVGVGSPSDNRVGVSQGLAGRMAELNLPTDKDKEGVYTTSRAVNNPGDYYNSVSTDYVTPNVVRDVYYEKQVKDVSNNLVKPTEPGYKKGESSLAHEKRVTKYYEASANYYQTKANESWKYTKSGIILPTPKALVYGNKAFGFAALSGAKSIPEHPILYLKGMLNFGKELLFRPKETGTNIKKSFKAAPETFTGKLVGESIVLGAVGRSGGRIGKAGLRLYDENINPNFVSAESTKIRFMDQPTDPISRSKLYDLTGKQQPMIHVTSADLFKPEGIFKAKPTTIELKAMTKGAGGFRKSIDQYNFYRSLPTEGKPNAYMYYAGINAPSEPGLSIKILPSVKSGSVNLYRETGFVQKPDVYAIPEGNRVSMAKDLTRKHYLRPGQFIIPAENQYGLSIERQVISPVAWEKIGNKGTRIALQSKKPKITYYDYELKNPYKKGSIRGAFWDSFARRTDYSRVKIFDIKSESTPISKLAKSRSVKDVDVAEYNAKYSSGKGRKSTLYLSDIRIPNISKIPSTKSNQSDKISFKEPSKKSSLSPSKVSKASSINTISRLSANIGYGSRISGKSSIGYRIGSGSSGITKSIKTDTSSISRFDKSRSNRIFKTTQKNKMPSLLKSSPDLWSVNFDLRGSRRAGTETGFLARRL